MEGGLTTERYPCLAFNRLFDHPIDVFKNIFKGGRRDTPHLDKLDNDLLDQLEDNLILWRKATFRAGRELLNRLWS